MNRNVSKQNVPDIDTIKQETSSSENDDEETPR